MTLWFIACLLAITCACSARRTPAEVPAPPQPDRPAEVPAAVVTPPEAPAPKPVPRPEEDPIECALLAGPGEPITTVGLSERVSASNAPHPSNESERVLFRQLYETLVRVDCSGQVRPALAASWQPDAEGRIWTVTLRENARFSDGTPVTSADVRASWSRGGDGSDLRPNVSQLVLSIVPLDERTAAITLRHPRLDAPSALAHPDLAVAKAVAGSPWPLGTRASRIAPDGNEPRGRDSAVITLSRDGLPPVQFRIAGVDPRDLLDQGAHLLLTRNPSALAYAATLPQFQSVPLSWQRTLVLITPAASAAPSLSDSERQALAADAVRGAARGAPGPFWWQSVPNCLLPPAAAPRTQSPPAPRIVYDANDTAARDLAQRLVGLSTTRTYQRSAGLSGDTLARAVRSGRDAAYVIALDSRPLDACADLHALTDRAPWLDIGRIVPLADTRLTAIVLRGRSGMIAEWDGGLLLAGGSDAK